jgi:hypothetical protein
VTESQDSAQLRGYFSAQEIVDSANWVQVFVGFVVGDVSVHEAPQPFDRIEMRT